MGSGPTTPQPGFRLLGAVVEGEGGPWFFKLTGPEATLASEREAFFGLLRGVAPALGRRMRARSRRPLVSSLTRRAGSTGATQRES